MMTGVRTERPPAFRETAAPVGEVEFGELLKGCVDMLVGMSVELELDVMLFMVT